MEGRSTRIVLRIVAFAVMAFIYLPLLVIVMASFNAAKIPTWPIAHYSTHWWSLAMHDDRARSALENSLKVGAAATVVALVLGTAAAFALSRYRFGLGITDYLVCRTCGAYVGAVMEDEGRLIATLNVNALDIRDSFDPAPPLHVYDGEDEPRRRSRRRKFWMPATVIA